AIPRAALPIATTYTRSNARRSISAAGQCNRVPLRLSFRCIVAGISIAARVLRKIGRATCLRSATEDLLSTPGMRIVPRASTRFQHVSIEHVRRALSLEQSNDVFSGDARHPGAGFERP